MDYIPNCQIVYEILEEMIGVCIVTYNEEKYIAECIDSALMQQCTEPVRVYVANDCSTDKTADVCRSYGNHIEFVDREKNLGLVGNTMALLDQIRKDGCEYIAMLDGDDYWCDPLKLQKEIDYMRAHSEYGLVHTCVDLLYPDGLRKDKRKEDREGNVFPYMESYNIANCSVLFRTECLDMVNFEEFQQQGLRSCDYVMYCIFASKWQFGFMPEHTAVWRRGHESVSGSKSVEKQIGYVQNDLAHWKYLSKLFPERFDYTEENGERYLTMCSFNIAFRLGDRKRAIAEYKKMDIESQKKYRLKYMVAHSALLTWCWRRLKKMS